jgi:hypothetical protein
VLWLRLLEEGAGTHSRNHVHGAVEELPSGDVDVQWDGLLPSGKHGSRICAAQAWEMQWQTHEAVQQSVWFESGVEACAAQE